MKIELQVNDKKYQGWENITINKSMLSISDTFSMNIYNGIDINIVGGDSVKILVDDKVFLSGFVDSLKLGISDTKKPLSVSGRSKSSDLIDCNIFENKQYNIQNAKVIISDLVKPFGITVSSSLNLEPLEVFDTKVGETYFNAINRLCKQNNILPISDKNGNIKLVKNQLIENEKVLKDSDFKELEFNQNFTNRFSEYTYKKEGIVVDVSDGKTTDTDIKRFRPFVGINTEDKTNKDLANWKKNNDISKSINLTAIVTGWDLEINTIVRLDTEIVKNSYLVKDIEYSKSDSGTISKLTLVDKGLFNV